MHSFQQGKNTCRSLTLHTITIEQFQIEEYLGCSLDASLSGKFITMKALKWVSKSKVKQIVL